MLLLLVIEEADPVVFAACDECRCRGAMGEAHDGTRVACENVHKKLECVTRKFDRKSDISGTGQYRIG